MEEVSLEWFPDIYWHARIARHAGPLKPEEIAPAYVLLESYECSSYITEEIPPIVGGYSRG